MPIIITDIVQGSDAWFQEKLGKPSASNASKIIQNNGKPSEQREGYLYELADQIVSGQREEDYKNRYMEMGNEREAESRQLYEIINDVEVEQVGVIYPNEKKQYLCSPDGLINREYGLELKNVLGKTMVKYLLAGTLPPEYFSQIQMSLLITKFKFWDFCVYKPGLRSLILRVERDETFISALEFELKLFVAELEKVVEKIK